MFIALLLVNGDLFAQEATLSLGNTYIHSDGTMTVFDQHTFEKSITGALPGLVGSERLPNRGYFNFVEQASWKNAQHGQFVDGYVRYFGQKPFLFPVGDNDKFRPAAVSNGSYVEMAYYGVDPGIAITSDLKGGDYPVLPVSGPFDPSLYGSSVIKVSKYEYWDINGPDAAFITLTWDENSEIDLITSGAIEELTIVGWDGTKWVKIPSTINTNSANLSKSDLVFDGPLSDLDRGSISTSIPVIPSNYEVYTFGASCNDIAIEVTADTTICIGQTITLTAESPTHTTAEIVWDNGETGSTITITPTETMYYSATAMLGECSAADDILVTVSDPSVILPEDFFICRGDEVRLEAETEPGMEFEWSNGTFGGDYIDVSPLSSETFIVTVTDEFGCQATDDVFIEVRDKPDVFTGRERSLCLGDSVFIQAFGSATGYGYLWSTGDTSDIITVSPTVDTEYEVYLSSNGCTDTSYVSVLILDPVPVEIVGDSVVCPGGQVTLAAIGEGFEYVWNTGDQDSVITINPTVSGAYSVTMTSEELCESVDEFYVSVFDESLVDLDSEVTICPGETAIFEATGILDSIVWPDGSTSTTFSVAPGQDTTFTATSYYNSCSTVHQLFVDVNDALDIDLGNDILICPGQSINLSAGDLYDTYSWSTGDTTSSITVSPAGTENYSVTVTSSSCQSSDSINVTVDDDDCGVDISVNKTADQDSVTVGETVTFTILVGNNTSAYVQGITISEKLPAGFTYLAHQASTGNYDEVEGKWYIEELYGFETALLELDAIVEASGNHTNTAFIINPPASDTVAQNNISNATIVPVFTGSIGDFVWHDHNGNGIQDAGEPGIEDIQLYLYKLQDPTNVIGILKTDSVGYFCFTELQDGDYFLKMDVPGEFMLSPALVSESDSSVGDHEDSNFDESNGTATSDTITIINGEAIKSVDGGLHMYSSIGDVVWLEQPNGINDIYTEGVDVMVDGVSVQLYDGVDSTMLGEEVTVNGRYLFEKLKPGAYYLRIYNLPEGTMLVTPNMGLPDRNSDFIPVSSEINNEGFTAMIYLGAEEHNMSIDAGIMTEVPPVVVPPVPPHIPGGVTPWTHNKRPIFRLPPTLPWGYTIQYLLEYAYWASENEERTKDSNIVLRTETSTIPTAEYNVFPNPARDVIRLRIESSEPLSFQGFLVSSYGQNVRKFSLRSVDPGTTTLEWNIDNIPSGQYFFNFYLGKKQHIEKIIIVD